MSTSYFSGTPARTAGAQLTPDEQSTLAERVRKREPEAEAELVRLFSDRIAFLVRMRARDPEAARDLTQEVLMAVVTAIRQNQLRDNERLAAFVYGTARNIINNFLRTCARQPQHYSIDAAIHAASPPDPVEQTERELLVRRALAVLDSTDRQILLLTLVEGLKPGEIATRLGLTAEVVRSRKSRALKKAIERVKEVSRR